MIINMRHLGLNESKFSSVFLVVFPNFFFFHLNFIYILPQHSYSNNLIGYITLDYIYSLFETSSTIVKLINIVLTTFLQIALIKI